MSGNSLRIVVADDEVDMRDFLCKILPHLGHQVVAVAEDGDQLILACKRTTPDLIITDLKMPHRDGLSAVEEIWQSQQVPVVFISAYPQELVQNPVANSPLTTILTKPVKRADLEPALMRVVQSIP